MAQIELVLVPYDSGFRDVRMGRGPEYLLERGMGRSLEDDGHQVTVSWIESRVEPPAEIAVAFDLARSVAAAVAAARSADRVPIVLAGNCFAAVGVLAGLAPDRMGVLWLDAHGDLNTPDTTRSGFLDGMALATITGRCWRGLAAEVPGFAPLPDHRLALVGVRDLDPPEEALAAALGICRVGPPAFSRQGARQAMAAIMTRVARGADSVYLHVDLDVLDPDVAAVNQFSAGGGLTLDDLRAVVEVAAGTSSLAAASITALDPEFDEGGRAAAAAIAAARWIAAVGTTQTA